MDRSQAAQTYDLFIACAAADRPWVAQHLLPSPGDRGLRLCTQVNR